MIVNPDHMSQEAVDQTLTLLEQRGYSGVISPHGWMDPGNWPRLWKLGGLAFPGHSNADQYVKEWAAVPAEVHAVPVRLGLRRRPRRALHPARRGRDQLPVQGPGRRRHVRPPGDRASARSTTRRKASPPTGSTPTGSRTSSASAVDKLAGDLWDGAEAYLQMWERAEGVKRARVRGPQAGRHAHAEARRELDERARPRRPAAAARARVELVRAGLGQPRAADVAVFGADGRVALVGSTAQGRRTSGVPPSAARSAARRGSWSRAAPPTRSARPRARRRRGGRRAAPARRCERRCAQVSGARATQPGPPSRPARTPRRRPPARTLAGTGNPVDDAALDPALFSLHRRRSYPAAPCPGPTNARSR